MESLDYDTVKAAVLRAYELVPEAYRQKFRAWLKQAKQTNVEFAREKKNLFEKWCLASKVTTYEELQELILLEDFKTCVPENVVVYLNEQKVSKLSDAAVLADEFALTHRTVFSSGRQSKTSLATETIAQGARRVNISNTSGGGKSVSKSAERRVCFYCLDPGHMISDCKAWKQKAINTKPKSVASIQSVPDLFAADTSSYDPFLLTGYVSLAGDSADKCVQVLRDTGSAQSFVVEDVLPFSDASYTGANVLVRGIEMGCISVPLHTVNLKSDLVTGLVQLGVCKKLPVDNVSLILGNDLAGGNVFPSPIVVSKPVVCDSTDLSATYPLAFPACAVTRSQSRSFQDVVDLSDSFLSVQPKPVEYKLSVENEMVPEHDSQFPAELPSIVGKEHLAAAQKLDPTLVNCIGAAVDSHNLLLSKVAYFWDDGILMRKWQPKSSEGDDWQTVYQIVLPSNYRSHVLKLAHENILAGHLGVTKTFQRIVKHFYWPGVKSAVSSFCRSCDICQRVGKPNQTIPKAPLHPIPAIGEPFERLVMDCVGPLPKSKHGHQYILTIMCTATRYPEAVPLRTLKAQVVLKEVIKFCTTFGLPRVIQTDQGSNFTSKVFGQMLKELGITHHMSSAYHPESQGAVERFSSNPKIFASHLLYRDWKGLGGWLAVAHVCCEGVCSGVTRI